MSGNASMKDMVRQMREQHKRDHPTCKYGDEPHFLAPSFGERGFYLCEVAEAEARGEVLDTRNHSRCRPPFDHEHKDHFVTPSRGSEGK